MEPDNIGPKSPVATKAKPGSPNAQNAVDPRENPWGLDQVQLDGRGNYTWPQGGRRDSGGSPE